ncbi:hypothetical protein TA3x_003821 [Tundrisphaera sp. TA3]|uniref:hypothetical protein n=1 Tax=Tundrisphaera sp. TA3 TaxID=3435775 RepID=UPI003EBC8734
MPHALFALILLGQIAAHDEANPVYHSLIAEGIRGNAGSEAFKLPAPTFPDDATPEAINEALEKVAGSKAAARELMRDSVTAPFILKTRDARSGDDHVRAADLWFVVHADLDRIDLGKISGQADDQAVEAGNMKFITKRLKEDDLREGKVELLPPRDGRTEWFTHLDGRLLDRISVRATDRVVATRTPASVVVAARTDHAFGRDGRYSNMWATVARKGAAEEMGPPREYAGGASYVKISKLAAEPGALLVEAHLVFFEPHGWFQGAPILRSKISVVAQDQIRRLRREIEQNRPK